MMAQAPNPLHAAHAQPQWAQLTRLAGDRAATLFEELRQRVSRIGGLAEELHYEPQSGWEPRYLMGGLKLFSVSIRPGLLEVTLPLDETLRQRLLAAPRVRAEIKKALEKIENPASELTLPLSDRAAVRAFSKLVLIRGKSIAAGRERPGVGEKPESPGTGRA